MIKNNFIITEEDKKHILNLHRLSNYRKPIRLKEQYSAMITDTPSDTTGGSSATGNSGAAGTTGTQTSKTFNLDYKKEQLQNIQKNGYFTEINFETNPTVAGEAYDRVKGLIDNFYRSRVFGMLATAFELAGDIYPDKKYNNMTYSQMSSNLSGATNDVMSKVQKTQTLNTWNSTTNPTKDETNLYVIKVLDSPFDSVPVYQLKDQYVDAIKMGTPDYTGSTESDGTTSSKDTQELNKQGFLDHLKKAQTNVKETFTDKFCISMLKTYVNSIVTRDITLTEDELRLARTTIAKCANPKDLTSPDDKNIFGKYTNKPAKSAYTRLDKTLEQQLESLKTRSDEFRINFDNPDRN